MASELLIPDVIWVKPVAFLSLLTADMEQDQIMKVCGAMALCISLANGCGREEAYELGMRMFKKAMEQEAAV